MNDHRLNIAVTSAGIAGRNFIETHLGASVDVVRRSRRDLGEKYSAIAGWGNKRSGALARELAGQSGLPCWLLEDGFLRSAGDGTDPQGLSLAVDDIGIYYDARQGSRLELLIATGCPQESLDRTRTLIGAWRAHRLSKYNHARDGVIRHRDHVLVADQTNGDASIDGALATSGTFRAMLEAALDEHPHSKVVLKVHPDVFAGRKSGHFDVMTPGMASRVEVIGQHVHAPDLLEHARAVYTVSSQIGFEALLWGRAVRTFGMPFYAGWGLSVDALASPERRRAVPLEDLTYAALIAYPRYVDPEQRVCCEVETVVEHIALQRRMRARFPETIHALGFSRWKKPIARAFFGGSEVSFVRHARKIPPRAQALAVWGSGKVDTGAPGDGRMLIRVEDGFVRSVGLGAALVKPSSWVLDDRGIYYDARSTSRIETLLSDAEFDPAVLERAARLRESIVARRLTKYNLGGARWRRPASASRVVLVAGQVEGDASLTYGGVDIRTNLAFLEAVRREEPDAYIVYKPHPDVVAGLRPGAVPGDQSASLCDEVLQDHSIIDVIREVDAVHVMTSLAGFEALLHGKPVTTHGLPFYAGWGLTVDRHRAVRRERAISLDMLVAATLILYPTYVSEMTGRFTTPERILCELDARRSAARDSPARNVLLDGVLRLAARWRSLIGPTRPLKP
ncbi:capsule polysaccharide biosynthesis protein [Caballeronia temeraria]|uniref:Capsule polysaccharide biosynthesis protein n=1 Tax=Caballeronia temeraria TaxID=1777137 RepID=A0A158CGQ2_9BURK|nr:capsular polysaccharide biosynthesis protein [Caballeronia temeraria]SAK81482.1 capsule polysaccharide biosynthesis protein [Caballeronia temeraria]